MGDPGRNAEGTAIRVRADGETSCVPLRVAGRILAALLGLGTSRDPAGIAAAVGRAWPERASDVEALAAFRFILTGGRSPEAAEGMAPEHRRALAFRHLTAFLAHVAASRPLALIVEDVAHVDEASLAWLEALQAGQVATGRLDVVLDNEASTESQAERPADPEPHPAVQAEGSKTGGAPAEAARLFLEAAEQSLACVATRTAHEQLQQAASLGARLAAEDPAWHARLLEARAAWHAATGALGAAILHSRQRLSLGGAPAALCRAYDRHLGYLVKKGEPGQALATCQEALARVPAGTPGRTKLLARRAQSLLLAGRHQEALADCADCLAHLDPDGDAQLAGFVYFLWGGVEIRRLDLVKARSALESAFAHFEAAGDLYNQAITLSDLGTVHVRLGETDRAAGCFERGLAMAERIGDRRLRAVLLNNQGMLVHQRGEMAQARSCFASALAIHREMDDQRSMGIALLNLGEVCLALGEREEADRYLSEALAVNEKIGAWDVMAETYRQIARLEGERGEKLAALDAIKQGTQIAEQTGQVELQGVMLRLLAGLQADLGNLGEALAAVERSIELLGGIDAPLELGRSFAEQGRLLRQDGQGEQAGAALARASALFTKLNAQFELASLPPPGPTR